MLLCFWSIIKYDKRENGRVVKKAYQKDDVDYILTEFNDDFYMFPVFGTLETKFWTVPSSNRTSKMAKDFLAEDILKSL